MGSDHRRWLGVVIRACNRVIEDGAKSEDRWLQTIVADVTELRDRLERELAALTADESR
jgi:hypothetical protein